MKGLQIPPACIAELRAARAALARALKPDQSEIWIAPKPETRSGFKRGDDIKNADGDYDEAAILRQTHYECYHCGSQWHDDGEFGPMRVALDESAYYVPSRTNALPGNVGFSWPQWANRRLSWGEIMLEYLVAKRLKETRNNVEKLKAWYQKVAAKAWNPNLAREMQRRFQAEYDVKLAQHDAWRLLMVIDNQHDLAQQWAMVLAVKQNGSVRQLWRGPLLGLKACRAKQMEFGADARGNPLLKDQWVFLDGRYRPEEICRHIVEHKYGHWATIDGERRWVAWQLMQGGRNQYYTHAEEKDKTRQFVCGDPRVRHYQVDGRYVEILVWPFSATACGERFEAARDGKAAETSWLPQLPDEPPDDHPSGLSHESQIRSCRLVPSKSYEAMAARMHYEPFKAGAPTHYFDMWRMTMAVLENWRVDGVSGVRSPEAEVRGPESGVQSPEAEAVAA